MILINLALSACASLDQEQCRTGPWIEIGRVDGQHGRDEGTFAHHQQKCGGQITSADREAYLSGRKEGLRQYSSSEGGYLAGL